MNKKFYLLFGAIFIIGVGFLIHSCSKDSNLSDESNYTAVPSDLLTTVKNWHTAQTQISGTLSINKSKNAYVLPPIWKEARLQQKSDGTSVIIVPSPDAGIDPTSTSGLVRKFVFTVQNDKVTAGSIIEMFSSKVSIESSKYTLIEDYADGKINKFTGGVISYDVNYNRLSSEVYKDGVKASNQQAKVLGISIESFNKKFGTTGKTRLGSTITTLDDCYYLIYYEYELDWPYNITYWEILGYYCGPPDNEAGGGGGGGGGSNDPPGSGGGIGPGQPYVPQDGDFFATSDFLYQTMALQSQNTCVTSIMAYINNTLCQGNLDPLTLTQSYWDNYSHLVNIEGVYVEDINSFANMYFYTTNYSSFYTAIDMGSVVMADIPSDIPNSVHNVAVVGYKPNGTLIVMDPMVGTLQEVPLSVVGASYQVVISGCKNYFK